MSNPLHKYWRPSTFGGQIGLDLIRSATLEKLFCDNLWKYEESTDGRTVKVKEACPFISFKTPEFVTSKRVVRNCPQEEL